jgi:hypothetical protein
MPAVKFFACLDFERKSSFCKGLVIFCFFHVNAFEIDLNPAIEQEELFQGLSAGIVSSVRSAQRRVVLCRYNAKPQLDFHLGP